MTSPRAHGISTARPASSHNVTTLTVSLREVLERVIAGDIDSYELSIRLDAFDVAVRGLEQRLEHLEARVIDLEIERER